MSRPASASSPACGSGSSRSSTPPGPAHPRTARRPDPPRGLRPRRRPAARPRRSDLAQLADRSPDQALTDRLRPLKATGLTHLVGPGRMSLRTQPDAPEDTEGLRPVDRDVTAPPGQKAGLPVVG